MGIYEKPQADKPTEKGAGEANLTEEMSGILGIAFGGETCTKAVGLGPIITGAYEDAPTQKDRYGWIAMDAASKSAKPDAKPAARSKFAEFCAKMAAQKKEASAAATRSALEREEPTVSGDVLAVFAMPPKVTEDAAPAVLIYEKPQEDKTSEEGTEEAKTSESAEIVTKLTRAPSQKERYAWIFN